MKGVEGWSGNSVTAANRSGSSSGRDKAKQECGERWWQNEECGMIGAVEGRTNASATRIVPDKVPLRNRMAGLCLHEARHDTATVHLY